MHVRGYFKRERTRSVFKKEAVAWVIKAAVVSARVPERCTKRPARIARRNAKCHSSPEKIVRYTARTVSRSAKIAVVKKQGYRKIAATNWDMLHCNMSQFFERRLHGQG